MTTAEKPKGVFPKKGWKKVNGVWKSPEQLARPVQTAADRRNWLRKQAGWPVRE